MDTNGMVNIVKGLMNAPKTEYGMKLSNNVSVKIIIIGVVMLVYQFQLVKGVSFGMLFL